MIMNINKTEAIRNAELSTAGEEGIEQGLQKEKCTIVRKMLAAHLSFEQIAEFTDLEIDEIKNYGMSKNKLRYRKHNAKRRELRIPAFLRCCANMISSAFFLLLKKLFYHI